MVANFDAWQCSHPYIKIIRNQRVANKENIMSVKECFIKKKVAKNFINGERTSFKFQDEFVSKMAIKFPKDGGLVTGTYTSWDKGSNVWNSEKYPLTGFVSGNVLTFTVSFPEKGSIAVWAGQTIWGPSNNLWELHTLWYLTEPTEPENAWEDTLAGCNIFTGVI